MFRNSPVVQSAIAFCCWTVFMVGSAAGQATQYRAPRDSDGELRWKFKKGQVFRMITEQNTSMSMSIGQQPVKSENQNINEMTLHIDDVDSEGTAKAAAVLDRMMMQIEANGQKMGFDSNDEDETAIGPFAEVIKMIRPIIGKRISQDMASTGKISNVNVPDDMLPEGGNPIVAGMLNKKSIEEMTSRGSLEFPASKLELGHTWQVKAEMNMGPAQVSTTTDYKYLGVKEGQDGPLHVIEGKISMSFPQGIAGGTIEIVHEDSTATFYFDGVNGRLHGSELHQDMKMKISAGGQSTEQHVLQKMKMSLVDGNADSAGNG